MKHTIKRKNKKRKTLRRIYGGAGRSEGFWASHLKKDKPKNATGKLAHNVETKQRKQSLKHLMSPPKHGSIRSENRLPHFELAKTIITRIINSNPTNIDINDYE